MTTPNTQSSEVEAMLKPFINKYDQVGSGIDNVHYWWICDFIRTTLTHLTQAQETRMREMIKHIWQMREDCRNDGFGQHVYIYDNIIKELTEIYLPNPDKK